MSELETRRQALIAKIVLQRLELRSDIVAIRARAPISTAVQVMRAVQAAAAFWKVGQLAVRIATVAIRGSRPASKKR